MQQHKEILLSLVLLLILGGCTPKTSEVIEIVEEPQPLPVEEESLTPCITLAKLEYPKRDDVETAYVLYRDFIKLNKFDEALPLWKKAFYNAPAGNGKIKYQFDDGVSIYKDLYNKNNKASAYVDTIMSIYDKRVECYGDPAYVNGRKAFDYYYFFSEHTTEEKTYELFKSNLDAKGKEADYFVINPFTKLLYDRFSNGTIDTSEARKYAYILIDAIEYGSQNCEGSLCESWEIIKEYAPVRLAALEGVENFYGCGYYMNKYYTAFLASPTDCEVINRTYSSLLRGNCSTEDARFIEVKNAKDEHCYTPPPPPGCLRLAFNAYEEGKYKAAVEQFQICVDKFEETEKKAKYLLLISKIYYRDIQNFPKARKYAYEAAKYKTNWGEPYMLIGKLYASSGPLCGPGRGWDSQVVTWAAIDKFNYAKKIDPSSTTEANKWINNYQQYMPKKEDIFFRSMKAGDPFRVPCWIQENTTVRTAD